MNYPLQQSASGLASLGRGNDSMLVHMTPREVGGLQSLAMAHGGSLTINPETGLPEAGFLDSILNVALPVVGGFFGMDPFLVAGIMGGKSIIEGKDPFSAAMSAFGGYTGANLGGNLKSFATPVGTGATTAEVNAIQNAPYTGALGSTGELGANMGFQAGPMGATDKLASSVANIDYAMPKTFGPDALTKTSPMDFGIKDVTNASNQNYLLEPTGATPTTGIKNMADMYGSKGVGVEIPGATTAPTIASKAGDFGGALSTAAKDPLGFAKEVGGGSAGMGAAKIGMYTASPFMGDILAQPQLEMTTSDAEKYDPNRRLYLGNDTGLRLLPNLNRPITAKEGGAVRSFAIGGPTGNPSVAGGLSDLYNRPEGQTLENISNDGYGIGRLDQLASQESLNTAKTLGYKMGGYLDGQGDGMSDSIPATIEGKQPARLADGEFVIPADVVSHIGNGSSKAGSKRLYSMLDRVRQARTGHTKQGKQIKPEKYMPA